MGNASLPEPPRSANMSTAPSWVSKDPAARRAEADAMVQDLLNTRHAARLSLPFPIRLPLASTLGFVSGGFLGLSHGAQEAGLRFRAENAHRFPSSQVGWYLYHKSKNYHMALGGVKEGLKMGCRQAWWVGVFVGMEELIDRGRAGVVRQWRGLRGVSYEEPAIAGHRDCASSVLAGLGTAGVFSAWNRFPVPTAARVAKMGAKVGLVYGVVQDVMSMWRGRPLGYVEFIKRHAFGRADEVE